MAATREPPSGYEKQLLDEFRTYDQHVDVVSAMEWLFTDPNVKGLPGTVMHFDRFAKISAASGNPLTPDFTVAFTDGSAIAGEIASVALHDNSVEKLCSQIMKYDGITSMPGPNGTSLDVGPVDVLLLVPVRDGLATVKRIIKDRLADPEHGYEPARRPCIAQFSRDETTYTFQHIPDPDNGALYEPAERDPNIFRYLSSGLNISADKFFRLKAEHVFINDPAAALYLATHLWSRTWPTERGSSIEDFTVKPDRVARTLREQYGGVSANDVRRALKLLAQAGLAVAAQNNNEWTITGRLLPMRNTQPVQDILARRAATESKPLIGVKKRRPASLQEGLF